MPTRSKENAPFLLLRNSLQDVSFEQFLAICLEAAPIIARLPSSTGARRGVAAPNAATIAIRTQDCLNEKITARIPTVSPSAEVRKWVSNHAEAIVSLGDCALGYMYELYNASTRKRAQSSVQTAGKNPSADELIAFTQLYTPEWVADYLIDQVAKENGTIIDPSCGAGHFLIRAASKGVPLEHLYGCDIDPIALWICALSLVATAEEGAAATLNLELVDDTLLGSLQTDWSVEHMLSQKFDAVVGNPPYIGRKLLPRALKEQLKLQFPNTHQDLSACFIERGMQLLKDGGRLGYITQSSIMYLPTYAKFREQLIKNDRVVSVVEAGTRVFPLQSGEKVNSILLVLEKGQQSKVTSRFYDLTKCDDKSQTIQQILRSPSGPATHGVAPTKVANVTTIEIDQFMFLLQRAAAFNYKCPPEFAQLRSIATKLSELAEIKQGLATTDNARFVKYWWQVARNELYTRWVPYIKGAGSEQWWHPVETVVDWGTDGQAIKAAVAETYPYLNGKTAWVVKNEQYYKREGLTFSFVNSRQLAVRYMPAGCIFDVAGSALFANSEDQYFLLGYLNSSFATMAATLLNPTINFQVGDLKEIPVISFTQEQKERISALARQALTSKQYLASYCETSFDWTIPEELGAAARSNDWDYAQFAKEFANAATKQCSAATQIDQIVKKAVNASATILAMCEQHEQARKPVQQPFKNEQEFAKFIISAWTNGNATQFRLKESDTQLPFDFSNQFHNWLQGALGFSYFEYFAKHFNTDQQRRFHKAPRMVSGIDDGVIHIM